MHEAKKAKAIELLAIAEQTQVEIAKVVGVSEQTICAWKRDPEFMKGVVDRSRELLKETLPGVYRALSKRSKKGSDRHIKIFLEHLEKLEESKAKEVNINFSWKQPTQKADNSND